MGCGASKNEKSDKRLQHDVSATKSVPAKEKSKQQEIHETAPLIKENLTKGPSPSPKRDDRPLTHTSSCEKTYITAERNSRYEAEGSEKRATAPPYTESIDTEGEKHSEFPMVEISEMSFEEPVPLKPYEDPLDGKLNGYKIISSPPLVDPEASYTHQASHIVSTEPKYNLPPLRDFPSLEKRVVDRHTPRMHAAPVRREEELAVNATHVIQMHSQKNEYPDCLSARRIRKGPQTVYRITGTSWDHASRQANSCRGEGSKSQTPVRQRRPSFNDSLDVSPRTRLMQTQAKQAEAHTAYVKPVNLIVDERNGKEYKQRTRSPQRNELVVSYIHNVHEKRTPQTISPSREMEKLKDPVVQQTKTMNPRVPSRAECSSPTVSTPPRRKSEWATPPHVTRNGTTNTEKDSTAQPVVPNMKASTSRPVGPNMRASTTQPVGLNVKASTSQPVAPNMKASTAQTVGLNVKASASQPVGPNMRASTSQPVGPNMRASTTKPVGLNVKASTSQPVAPNMKASTAQRVIPNMKAPPTIQAPQDITEAATNTLSSHSQQTYTRPGIASRTAAAQKAPQVTNKLETRKPAIPGRDVPPPKRPEAKEVVNAPAAVPEVPNTNAQIVSKQQEYPKWQVSRPPPVDNSAWAVLRQIRFVLQMRNAIAV